MDLATFRAAFDRSSIFRTTAVISLVRPWSWCRLRRNWRNLVSLRITSLRSSEDWMKRSWARRNRSSPSISARFSSIWDAQAIGIIDAKNFSQMSIFPVDVGSLSPSYLWETLIILQVLRSCWHLKLFTCCVTSFPWSLFSEIAIFGHRAFIRKQGFNSI